MPVFGVWHRSGRARNARPGYEWRRTGRWWLSFPTREALEDFQDAVSGTSLLEVESIVVKRAEWEGFMQSYRGL